MSTGIVGYNVHSLSNGQQAVGGDFLSIGTNGCWLSELKVCGTTAATKIQGSITLQRLGSEGESLGGYNYWKGASAPRATEGWYQGVTRITGEKDVFLAGGTGVWIKGIDGYTLTCAGEVLTTELPIALKAGQQMLANPYPTTLNLSQIKVTGPTAATKIQGTITLQLLGSSGESLGGYNYWKGASAPRATEGWYQGVTRITGAKDVPLAPGKGIWVKGLANHVLTFTCPFSTDKAE